MLDDHTLPPQVAERLRTGQALVLFDGVCTLCDASVHFILDRDRGSVFCFASLQSELGGGLLRAVGLPPDWLEGLMLVDADGVFVGSSAALRIAGRLTWPWRWLRHLLWLPLIVREPVYLYIARNRYRWFGTHDACRMPTPALRARLLE